MNRVAEPEECVKDGDLCKSRVLAALGNEGADARLLAEVLLADELDLEAVLPGQLLGVLSDHLSQRLGALRVVEHADVAGGAGSPRMPGHGIALFGSGYAGLGGLTRFRTKV